MMDFLCSEEHKHTDVEKNCAILLLVDDVVAKDLVVQGLGILVCGGHDDTRRENNEQEQHNDGE